MQRNEEERKKSHTSLYLIAIDGIVCAEDSFRLWTIFSFYCVCARMDTTNDTKTERQSLLYLYFTLAMVWCCKFCFKRMHKHNICFVREIILSFSFRKKKHFISHRTSIHTQTHTWWYIKSKWMIKLCIEFSHLSSRTHPFAKNGHITHRN